MPKITRPRKSRNEGDVVITADQLPKLSPAEIKRYAALPDGTPDAESPELSGEYLARLKRADPWAVRPQGRPAAGTSVQTSTIVSLRMPVSLRAAVAKRAKKLHVSFNAAMQEAAASWVGAGEG